MTPKQIASIKKACEGKTRARLEREAQGIFPLEFMRLTLTDEAFAVVKEMSSTEFKDFVSEAIIHAAQEAEAIGRRAESELR